MERNNYTRLFGIYFIVVCLMAVTIVSICKNPNKVVQSREQVFIDTVASRRITDTLRH